MIKRKVHYNVFTDTGEQVFQRHRWTVAILNEPREIQRIEQRFFRQLAPVNDLDIHYESLIQKSGGLHCKIFSFSSNQGKIYDHTKIYDSPKFKRNRDLSERNGELDWERYAKTLF